MKIKSQITQPSCRKMEADQEYFRNVVSRQTPDLIGAAMQGVPFIGPLLGEGAKTTTEHFLSEHHRDQLRRDAERLENPIDDLTRAFVDELNRLADTLVTVSPVGTKREQRIILVFDTFEQLAIKPT